jgi:hypothetical protein
MAKGETIRVFVGFWHNPVICKLMTEFGSMEVVCATVVKLIWYAEELTWPRQVVLMKVLLLTESLQYVERLERVMIISVGICIETKPFWGIWKVLLKVTV